jgi:hypothetical protein
LSRGISIVLLQHRSCGPQPPFFVVTYRQPLRIRPAGDPYEVLSEVSSRMAGAYESEDLLPRMARILGEGTGAASARVWLKVGDELRVEATWPVSADSPALPMKDGGIPTVRDASLVLPVRDRGDLLGALSLAKPPG